MKILLSNIQLICNFFPCIHDKILAWRASQVFCIDKADLYLCVFFGLYKLIQNWDKETNFYLQFDFIVFIHNFQSKIATLS